ncbi:MAG TPA: type II toxin-antitoxin system prevent-host-death family antitoxin [Chitinophaga sp.]|uniref:type II toxin-antitoxin system Phd/YefM family antitoxin n=1 Tax=Chitinophaga sp. TaxID=1869181 RepID=UPI002F95B14D
MNVINFREFRNSLKKYLDSVTENHEVLIVPRAKDKSVVVISLEEYNSMKETAYLNRSDANRTRLTEALERSNKGNFESHNLVDE